MPLNGVASYEDFPVRLKRQALEIRGIAGVAETRGDNAGAPERRIGLTGAEQDTGFQPLNDMARRRANTTGLTLNPTKRMRSVAWHEFLS
jgi:hypothetical protein